MVSVEMMESGYEGEGGLEQFSITEMGIGWESKRSGISSF